MNIAVSSIHPDEDGHGTDSSVLGAFDAVVALIGSPGSDGAQCRFPYGEPREPDFRFCCNRSKNGSAYCSSHHAQCSGGYFQHHKRKP